MKRSTNYKRRCLLLLHHTVYVAQALLVGSLGTEAVIVNIVLNVHRNHQV